MDFHSAGSDHDTMDMSNMTMGVDNTTMVMMSKMYLHGSIGTDVIWFESWMPSSISSTFGACVGLFLLGMFVRFLSGLRRVMEGFWKRDTLRRIMREDPSYSALRSDSRSNIARRNFSSSTTYRPNSSEKYSSGQETPFNGDEDGISPIGVNSLSFGQAALSGLSEAATGSSSCCAGKGGGKSPDGEAGSKSCCKTTSVATPSAEDAITPSVAFSDFITEDPNPTYLRQRQPQTPTYSALSSSRLAGEDFGLEYPRWMMQRRIEGKGTLPFVWRNDVPRGLLEGLFYLLGYLLMLVVMTYNIWFILAIVLGVGVGETLFGRHGH